MTAADFREWRLHAGLSLTGAGEALGKDRSTIRRYQNGQMAVPRHVEILCDELGPWVRFEFEGG